MFTLHHVSRMCFTWYASFFAGAAAVLASAFATKPRDRRATNIVRLSGRGLSELHLHELATLVSRLLRFGRVGRNGLANCVRPANKPCIFTDPFPGISTV